MDNIKKFVKRHGYNDGVCMVYHTSDNIKTFSRESVLGIYFNEEQNFISLLIEGNEERNYYNSSDIEIKHVWNQVAIENIDVILHDCVISFKYEKKDGTIREARGTLLPDLCPKTKGEGRPMPEHLQLYYDLDCKSYKCFTKSKLLEVKEKED